MAKLKCNEKRGRLTILSFSMVLFIFILLIASNLMQYKLLVDIQSGVFISNEEANANDLRQSIIVIISGLIILFNSIVFIFWFRRAYYNLHQLKLPYLRYSEGWAAGAWFVPMLNLIRPFQIMKEIWVETQMQIIPVEERYKTTVSTNIIIVWWIGSIIAIFFHQIADKLFKNPVHIDEFVRAQEIQLAGNFIYLLGVILSLMILIKLIKSEKILFALQAQKEIELENNTYTT
jgi:hypothetical protein